MPLGYRRLVVSCRVINPGGPTCQLRSPKDAALFCRGLISEGQEVFVAILLDVRKHVIAYQEVFRGTADMCLADPRDIFRAALVIAPTICGLLLVHNHPSGDCSPSDEDVRFADRITDAGALLNIPIIDVMIVAEEGYWSREQGGTSRWPARVSAA
jgi:DNA repair protein RadC